MVTSNHEAAHRIFQEHPEVLTQMLELLGVAVPGNSTFEAVPPDLEDRHPRELVEATVLRITPTTGARFLVAVASAAHATPDAPLDWAYLVSYLGDKFEVPVLLLVTTQDRETAKWAAGPFRFGPTAWNGLSLRPLVVGPGNVPRVTDATETAANPGLAAFAACIHAHPPKTSAVADQLFDDE